MSNWNAALLAVAFAALLFTDARYEIQSVFSLAGSWFTAIVLVSLLAYAAMNYPR